MLVIMCTCPDEATASKLASGLVEERLAACVNILSGVRSIYRWQGEICDDAEVLMIIKSQEMHYEAVESWLQEQHPYAVPEVVALPVSSVSDNYRKWLETSVKKS